MISKLGKLQQKVILILNSNEQLDICEIAVNLKLYPSETRRVLYRMEKKRILKFKTKDKVILNSQQQQRKDLSDTKQLIQFYSNLRNGKLFDNKADHVLIQADMFFINIFNNSIQDNESLENLKEVNKKQYKAVTQGLKDALYIQADDLKSKVFSWSESRYKVIFEGNKIKLIDTKFNVVARLESFTHFATKLNKAQYQLLSEVIEIVEKSIKELNDFSITIADHDYLNC